MKPIINISTEQGGLYFSLFYFLAVAFCITIVIIGFNRSKYPVVLWSLIILSGLTGLVSGTKIFSYTFGDLQNLFMQLNLPFTSRKTILGGLAGLMAGVFLAKSILKFNYPVLDRVAVALPVSMAIQKVGCLMTGCCYGKPCQLPWAISYSGNHIPFHEHLTDGLIVPGSTHSLAIHPTQFYAILAYLVIALIIAKTGHRMKASGNKFLTVIAMILFWRFFEEFLRDPHAGFFAPQYFLGINHIQWIVAIAALIFALIIYFRENLLRKEQTHKPLPEINNLRIIFLFLTLLSIVLITFKWFTMLERIVVLSVFIPTAFIIIWHLFKISTLPEFRYITITLILLGALFSSQTIEPKTEITDEYQKITWQSLHLGGTAGKFSNIATLWIHEGCGSYPVEFPYKHNFYNAALGYSKSWKNGKYFIQQFSLNTYFVQDEFKCTTNSINEINRYLAINPSYKIDFEWWGLGGGFHLGEFRYARVYERDFEAADIKEGGIEKLGFYPQYNIRLGPKKYFYVEERFADFFPSPSPMPRNLFGVGSGLGKLEKHVFGIGLADKSLYMSGTIAINRNWLIEAFYMDNFKNDFNQTRGVALSTHFRFGFRESKQ